MRLRSMVRRCCWIAQFGSTATPFDCRSSRSHRWWNRRHKLAVVCRRLRIVRSQRVVCGLGVGSYCCRFARGTSRVVYESCFRLKLGCSFGWGPNPCQFCWRQRRLRAVICCFCTCRWRRCHSRSGWQAGWRLLRTLIWSSIGFRFSQPIQWLHPMHKLASLSPRRCDRWATVALSQIVFGWSSSLRWHVLVIEPESK